MYEAIRILRELKLELNRLNVMKQYSKNTIDVNKLQKRLQEAIDRIEKDLAKIQEGSYIF